MAGLLASHPLLLGPSIQQRCPDPELRCHTSGTTSALPPLRQCLFFELRRVVALAAHRSLQLRLHGVPFVCSPNLCPSNQGNPTLTLVCDKLGLSGVHKTAFDELKNSGKLTHMAWRVFLARTRQMHQAFLNEAERQRVLAAK